MYTYRVKVLNKVFLWGGAGIKVNLTEPLFLSCRVDEIGDPVDLSFVVMGAGALPHPPVPVAIGTLQQGETITISLQGRSGIIAECAQGVHTYLTCAIHPSA